MQLIPLFEEGPTVKYPFANSNVKIIPKENEHRYREGRKPGGNVEDWVGNFELPNWRDTGYLYKLDDHDQTWAKDVKLKADEVLFRYDSRATRIGKMEPMIKINVNRGLAYFLTDEGNEKDEPIFDTKGAKVQYLNIKDGYLNLKD